MDQQTLLDATYLAKKIIELNNVLELEKIVDDPIKRPTIIIEYYADDASTRKLEPNRLVLTKELTKNIFKIIFPAIHMEIQKREQEFESL